MISRIFDNIELSTFDLAIAVIALVSIAMLIIKCIIHAVELLSRDD